MARWLAGWLERDANGAVGQVRFDFLGEVSKLGEQEEDSLT